MAEEETQPLEGLNGDAVTLNEWYLSLQRAGFSRRESMRILLAGVAGAAAGQCERE